MTPRPGAVPVPAAPDGTDHYALWTPDNAASNDVHKLLADGSPQRPNGTTKPVLTSADGLASPSATAVRGNRPHITDGGVPEPHDAKPQTARTNLPALLAGAAH